LLTLRYPELAHVSYRFQERIYLAIHILCSHPLPGQQCLSIHIVPAIQEIRVKAFNGCLVQRMTKSKTNANYAIRNIPHSTSFTSRKFFYHKFLTLFQHWNLFWIVPEKYKKTWTRIMLGRLLVLFLAVQPKLFHDRKQHERAR